MRQHAADLDEPARTVARWLAGGMPPSEPARSEWVGLHKATAKNRPKGDSFQAPPGSAAAEIVVAKHLAEIRYRELQNRLLELQVAEAKGEMVDVGRAGEQGARIHGLAVNALRGLGSKLADRIAGMVEPARIQALIDEAVGDILDKLKRQIEGLTRKGAS